MQRRLEQYMLANSTGTPPPPVIDTTTNKDRSQKHQKGPLRDSPEKVTETAKYYKNCDYACWSCGYDCSKQHHSGNYRSKKKDHISNSYTDDNPAAEASIKTKEFLKWVWWRWRPQLECNHTKKRSTLDIVSIAWNESTKDHNSDGPSIENRIWNHTNRPSQ